MVRMLLRRLGVLVVIGLLAVVGLTNPFLQNEEEPEAIAVHPPSTGEEPEAIAVHSPSIGEEFILGTETTIEWTTFEQISSYDIYFMPVVRPLRRNLLAARVAWAAGPWFVTKHVASEVEAGCTNRCRVQWVAGTTMDGDGWYSTVGAGQYSIMIIGKKLFGSAAENTLRTEEVHGFSGTFSVSDP